MQPPQSTPGGSPPRTRRTLAWVGGAVAAVLVLTAGLAVPMVAHAQRVQAYTELVAQGDAVLADRAESEATLDAAIALAVAQRAEALSLADRVIELGEATEPILSAEHAQALIHAGTAATVAIGGDPEPDDERARLHAALVEATEALRAEDERARAAAEEEGEAQPEPLAPPSFLLLDVAEASRIIGAAPTPERVEAVADDAVTAELLESTEARIASVEREISQLASSIRAEEQRMAEFASAIAPAVDGMRAAAEAATAQAATVVEQTQKAPDASAAVTTAAQHAQQLGETEDAAELLDGLHAYVEAARAAQTAHAEAVEAERAAAAAAAAAAASRPAASSGSASSNGPRLCARYRGSWGGGATLVLVPC